MPGRTRFSGFGQGTARWVSLRYCLGLLRNFPAVILGSSRKRFCGSTLWIFQFGALARKLDPGGGFSLQAGGLLQHRGFQYDSLWASLHVRLALCSLDSSCVLELWEGFLLQFLPPQERNFCNPSSPRTLRVQGQGIPQLSGLSGLS